MKSITRSIAVCLLATLALALPAAAQVGAGPGLHATGARDDLLSWRLLAQVELVRLKDRYVPQYSSGVMALDRKAVKLRGFMVPLETGGRQTHFVLSALPQTCPFCMPGGPEQLVEVKSSKAVKYGFEPLVMSGRLMVLKDDPTGIFYRLVDAVPAE